MEYLPSPSVRPIVTVHVSLRKSYRKLDNVPLALRFYKGWCAIIKLIAIQFFKPLWEAIMAFDIRKFKSLINQISTESNPQRARKKANEAYGYLTKEVPDNTPPASATAASGEDSKKEISPSEQRTEYIRQVLLNPDIDNNAKFIFWNNLPPEQLALVLKEPKPKAADEKSEELDNEQMMTGIFLKTKDPKKILAILASKELSEEQRNSLFKTLTSDKTLYLKVLRAARTSGLKDGLKDMPLDVQYALLTDGASPLYRTDKGRELFNTLPIEQRTALLDKMKPEQLDSLLKAPKGQKKEQVVANHISQALQEADRLTQEELKAAEKALETLQSKKDPEATEEQLTAARTKVEQLEARIKQLETVATDLFKGLATDKERRAVLLSDKFTEGAKTRLFNLLSPSPQAQRNFLNSIAPWPWQKKDLRVQFFKGLTEQGRVDFCINLLASKESTEEEKANDRDLIKTLFIGLDPKERVVFLQQLLNSTNNQAIAKEIAADLMRHPDLTYQDHLAILQNEDLSDEQVQTLFNAIPTNREPHSWLQFAKDMAKPIGGIAAGTLFAALVGGPIVGILVAVGLLFGFIAYKGLTIDDNINFDRKLKLLRDLPEEKACVAFCGMNSNDQAEFLRDGRLPDKRAVELFTAAVDASDSEEADEKVWELFSSLSDKEWRQQECFDALKPEAQAKAIQYLLKTDKTDDAMRLVNAMDDSDKVGPMLERLNALDPEAAKTVFQALYSTGHYQSTVQAQALNGLAKNRSEKGDIDAQYKLLMSYGQETTQESKRSELGANPSRSHAYDPKQIANIMNSTTLTGTPILQNAPQLFVKMATENPEQAAAVMTAGNGKKLFSHLAETLAETAQAEEKEIDPQIIIDVVANLSDSDKTKYLSHLASTENGRKTLQKVIEVEPNLKNSLNPFAKSVVEGKREEATEMPTLGKAASQRPKEPEPTAAPAPAPRSNL